MTVSTPGGVWRSLVEALRSDPTDLEYLVRDPESWAVSVETMAGGVLGLVRCAAIFVVLMARDLWRHARPRRRPAQLPRQRIVFFVSSRTESEALAPIAERVGAAAWFTCVN